MTQTTLGQFTGDIHYCATEQAYDDLAKDAGALYLVPARPMPTKVSDLTNDSGFITSSGSCARATSAGSADTATTAASCSGNAATATTASNYAQSGTIATALTGIQTQLDGKQATLPTTSTAGKVLKSTSTAGTVAWGDESGGVTDVRLGSVSSSSSVLVGTVAYIPIITSTAEPSGVATDGTIWIQYDNSS